MPVPMQLLGAAWGLIRGELAAATGSSILAATWLALALATINGPAGPPGPTKAESLMLFAAAAALLVPVTAELVDGELLPAAILLTTACRFALTGVLGIHPHAGLGDGAEGIRRVRRRRRRLRRRLCHRATDRGQPLTTPRGTETDGFGLAVRQTGTSRGMELGFALSSEDHPPIDGSSARRRSPSGRVHVRAHLGPLPPVGGRPGP